jgi:hypothetical protein
MSPEAREKLSRIAKERHARGEFGGSKFGKMGGRPRKDRVAKRVAQAAQTDEMAQQLIQVFRDAIQEDQPTHIRIKAAEALIAIERDEARIAMAEEEHDAKSYSREELLKILSGNLTTGPISALLRRQIEPEAEIIDAEAVEVQIRNG